jgi:hypothetical protein
MQQPETHMRRRIKRMTKKAKVLRALRKGMSVQEAAKRYDAHLSLVYAAQKQLRDEAARAATIIPSPGLTSLAVPSTPPDGLGSLPIKPEPPAGTLVLIKQPEKPSLWARFKNWAFGFSS